MLEQLRDNWWLVAARGVAGVLFGIVVLLDRSLALVHLVKLFGAWAIVDGAFAMATALRHLERERWASVLLHGTIGVFVGIVAWFIPWMSARALVVLVGLWAVAMGGIEIAAAKKLRKFVRREWLLVAAAVVSVAFGALSLSSPSRVASAFVPLLGAYGVVVGVLLVALSLRLRPHGRELPPGALAA